MVHVPTEDKQNRDKCRPNTLRSRQWHPIPNPERCVTRETDTLSTMQGLVIPINPWTVPGIHSEDRPPSICMRSPNARVRRPRGPDATSLARRRPHPDCVASRGRPLHRARVKVECKSSPVCAYVSVLVSYSVEGGAGGRVERTDRSILYTL